MNSSTRTAFLGAVIGLVVSLLAACPNPAPAAGPTRVVSLVQNVPAGQSAVNNQAEFGYATASIMQSQADMIRAQAEMVKAQAAAAESWARVREMQQKTRSLALDNNLKYAKTFYEKRKLWEEHQTQHPRDRATPEEVNRYSRSNLPKRLESYQVSSRGITYWPAVFERPEFAEERNTIDRLFKQRQPRDAGPESDFCQEVRGAADAMRDDLRGMLKELSPAQYVAARKFIDGVAREAELPPEISGVAAR